MSAGKPYLDSNVLLYLVANDAKAEKAEILLDAGGVISVQVLNTSLLRLPLANGSWRGQVFARHWESFATVVRLFL